MKSYWGDWSGCLEPCSRAFVWKPKLWMGQGMVCFGGALCQHSSSSRALEQDLRAAGVEQSQERRKHQILWAALQGQEPVVYILIKLKSSFVSSTMIYAALQSTVSVRGGSHPLFYFTGWNVTFLKQSWNTWSQAGVVLPHLCSSCSITQWYYSLMSPMRLGLSVQGEIFSLKVHNIFGALNLKNTIWKIK